MFVPVTDIRKIAELYVAGLLWHNRLDPNSTTPIAEPCTPGPHADHDIERYVNQWTMAFAPHMQSGVYGYVTEE